jgi:hypothetical protein
MRHSLIAVLVLTAVVVLPAAAQTSSTTTGTDATVLSNFAPQENAGGGSVSQRAPGTWVRGAITRHSGLQGLRLNGPRFGQPNTEEAQLRFGASQSSSSSSGTSGTDLSSLLSLFNQSGGIASLANLANSGNLSNLINSLTGNTGSSTSTTGGMSAADAAALQNLIALGQSVGGTAQANNAALPSQPAGQMSSKTGTMQTNNPYAFGGAIARLPKAADRFQTTTTTQPSSTPKFGTRLLTALTETFFNSIALAMSTPAFVTVLENALRPLVQPAHQ